MTGNELKVIRENIACPQFGDDHYGPWGALTISQRRTIYKMWDEITRQKAEIERLQEEIELLHTDYTYKLVKRKAKAEAIKEFAERLNEIITEIYNKHIFGNNDLVDEEKDAIINFSDDITYKIDNLVKEMVGDV